MKKLLWIALIGLTILAMALLYFQMRERMAKRVTITQKTYHNILNRKSSVAVITAADKPVNENVNVIYQQRQKVDQCWRRIKASNSSIRNLGEYRDELQNILEQELQDGVSYERLVAKTPTTHSGVYLLALQFAWESIAFAKLNYHAQDALTQPEYLKSSSLPQEMKKISLLRDMLAQDIEHKTQQVNKFTEAELAQAIANHELSITAGNIFDMREHIPRSKMLALIDALDDDSLAQKPLVSSYFRSIPTFNIADYAVWIDDLPLLKHLAKRGITPKQIDGIYSPIDEVLLSADSEAFLPRQNHSDDDVLVMLQYLVAQGYSMTATQQFGLLTLGSELVGTNGSDLAHNLSPKLLDYVVQRVPQIAPISAFPSAPSDDIVHLFNQLDIKVDQYRTANEQCVELNSERLQHEQLYSNQKIAELVAELASEYKGEQLLAVLQEVDPTLVDIAPQKIMASGSYINLPALQTAAEQGEEVLTAFIQQTPLSPMETTNLLAIIASHPQWAEVWNQRIVPESPSSLLPLRNITQENLRIMVDNGFDLDIKDAQDHNLYGLYFQFHTENVAILLTENIDPFSNIYGPDALDYALDISYQQDQLFTGIDEILKRCSMIEVNHLHRFARLKKFCPELYQQLLALDERVNVGDDITPNPVLAIELSVSGTTSQVTAVQ